MTRVRPLLLLATRAEDAAADDEYEAFLRYTELPERLLRRVRLERAPLGAIDLDDVSGVLVGGSPFTVSDPPERKSPVQRRVEAELADLVDAVLARRVPFLGACFGIGTLGAAVGAVVDRRYGEDVGAVPISLTEAGRADRLFGALPPVFEAFVGHKEAIAELPSRAVLLASSPTCPVQAFRVGPAAWATQFHPELDIDGLATRVEVYQHAGYFDPDEADTVTALARASDVVHPPELLRRFVQLFVRDDEPADVGALS